MRILILTLTYLISIPAFAGTPTHKTMIVIDAGSTGTRVHLYDYSFSEGSDTARISQRFSDKITPGLGQISRDKTSIDAYLTLLMKDIPQEEGAALYFYATGGMRILPKAVQSAYYTHVKHWFAEHYKTANLDIKTIDGAEEGVYDWLSVNYQLGLFNDNKVLPVGVIDLGGTSVQIVIPTDKQHANHSLLLFNRRWYLNSHSFLGLGQTQIKEQLMEHGSCYAQRYPLINGALAKGRSQDCVESLSALVNDVHQVGATMKHSFSGTFPKRWYVMGSITYTARAEVLNYDSSNLNVRSLLDTANHQVCTQDWNGLNARFPNDAQLESYCLYSSYYFALITNGFGVDENQPLEQLSNESLNDWTMGVALLKAQQL